ncbi:ligand-gated ion channel 4-like isoform X2 [Branchiostoma floridae x Branchiostoma japonicum]
MFLQDALLTNYSTHGAGALPVADPTAAVNLLFGVAIHQILELRGSEQTLVTRLWLRMSWQDDFLQWNPEKHGGIKTLALPVKKVWTPDIFLYNNVHGDAGGLLKVADVVVDSDGNVTWLQPGIFRSACDMDVSLFPFDEQTCELHFGSWVHPTSRINITPGKVDTSEYQENEQFMLAKSEIHGEVRTFNGNNGNVSYSLVKVLIHLKRRCDYYKFNMIQPWAILMALNIAAFYIPTDCGERLGFTITILLSLILFQEVVAQQLPHTSTTTPLLCKYLTTDANSFAVAVLRHDHRPGQLHNSGHRPGHSPVLLYPAVPSAVPSDPPCPAQQGLPTARHGGQQAAQETLCVLLRPQL